MLVNQRIYYRKTTGILSNNTIQLQVFTETVEETVDVSGNCVLDDGVNSQNKGARERCSDVHIL